MFRSEVIEARKQRLTGDASVAVPIAWQLIGLFVVAATAIAFLFLWLADYSRVETASGFLVPAAGVAGVVPSRQGVITRILVKEGDRVAAGALLAEIRTEEQSADGVTASQRVQRAIAAQDLNMVLQERALDSAMQADLRRSEQQHVGLEAEIAQLEAQIGLQRTLVASAERDMARVHAVADRGFVSGRDVTAREEQVLSRQQVLAQLTQTLSAKRGALNLALTDAEGIRARHQNDSAAIAAARAGVAQQAAETGARGVYVLRAPIAGTITAQGARIGQTAVPQDKLMTIVPTDSPLQAQLYVPSSAIGFVKPDQRVRLSIDAFPYQRFGTVSGRLLSVATSSVELPGTDGKSQFVFPATVSLDRSELRAYGRSAPLVSGMTLNARIVTERQSLLQWLFEPLFAVRRR